MSDSLKSTTWLVFIAVAITTVNLVKPVHIDDTYFLRVAEHIAAHPLDPFGFQLFWQDQPMNAFDAYVPPFLLYWFALAGIISTTPIFLKVSLLPFVITLVLSIHSLAKRANPDTALPATAFLAVSPALLPGWNLMLDLPSLSLSLGAIALVVQGFDKWDYRLMGLAALFASMGALTKFTGLVAPGVILIYSLVQRRPFTGIGIGMVVLAVIVLWEFTHHQLYGHTQLLWGLQQGGTNIESLGSPLHMTFALVPGLGALSFLLAALYWPAKDQRSELLHAIAALAVIAGIYIFSIIFETTIASFWLAGLILLIAMATRAIREYRTQGINPWVIFLLGWLALEIVAYYVISPFPAARRMIGLLIPLTLLAFILAANVRAARLLLAGQLCVCAVYLHTDYLEASAQRTVVDDAHAHIQSQGGHHTMWYVGHWGFAYYADKQNMQPIIPGISVIETGDWILQPERVHAQRVRPDMSKLDYVGAMEVQDANPFQTMPYYYSGMTPISVKPDPVRLRLHLFRANAPHVIANAVEDT